MKMLNGLTKKHIDDSGSLKMKGWREEMK